MSSLAYFNRTVVAVCVALAVTAIGICYGDGNPTDVSAGGTNLPFGDASAVHPNNLPSHRLFSPTQLQASNVAGVPQSVLADQINTARERMISEQLVARGINNPSVLAAMRSVPRFVPREVAADQFEDKPLDIRFGRTVESAYVVALVADQFHPSPRSSDRILEIGTGCGYQTAVLSLVAKEVYSVESNAILARRAQANLQNHGYTNNAYLRICDVTLGWPEAAPFDAIVVNGSIDQVSDAIIGQLKTGGQLIIPADQNGNQQVLEKMGNQIVRLSIRPVRLAQTAPNKIDLPAVKHVLAPPSNLRSGP